MPDRGRQKRAAARLAAGAALLIATACLETSIVQVTVDDIIDFHLASDSLAVAVGHTVQAHAVALDANNALLAGLDVSWTTMNAAVASVDTAGLVTGEAPGVTQIVASVGAHADTSVVTVALPPVLVLSMDSVGFSAQVGQADPPPDTVDVTNGGSFTLTGLAVDSIVYAEATTGWLSAQLGATAGPTTLELSATTAGITASGFLHATVWVSATDADGSPASVEVVLQIQAGPAATVELDAGEAQTGEVGLALPTSPSVLVKDAFDNPVAGAAVTFAVSGGGGSVTGSPATTDASGVARVGSWVLGQTKGGNTLDATLGGIGTVPFTATGVPGPATTLQVVAGDGQSAVAGSAVSNFPQVAALDAFDNGVEGVDIAFSVASGGGDITGTSQTTDTAGVATAGTWTLGTTAGPNTVDAVATNIADTVTFTATGLPGGLDEILLVAGDAQTDTVAATLAVQYTVKVEDINDNGIPGIPVSFSVTGGGGSITALDTTDATGVAAATRILGTAPGAQTAEAAVGGLGPVDFSATATVGTPSKLVVVAGSGQNATVNTTVATPPSVRVTDKFDNPIAGHSVTFAAVNAGATISPGGAQLTLADGTAALTSWKLGTVAATASDTVAVTPAGGAVAPNPLRVTATANPGTATSFVVFQGDSQTATTGSGVSTAPGVRVADTYGNGISGRTVNFSASGSGTVGSTSALTNSNGVATTSWTVDVTGHSMGTNGTFQNTLTASTSGFSNVQISGFARYSYATHVNPIFSCGGCHDFGGSSGGLNFDGTAAQDYAAIVNVRANCDASLPTQYRRISNLGGVAASDTLSILIQKLDPAIPGVGACGAHGGGEFPAGATQLTILRAWVRNGAPNN